LAPTEPRDDADSFEEFLADWLDARAEGRERELSAALATRPDWSERLQEFLADEAPLRAAVERSSDDSRSRGLNSAFFSRSPCSGDSAAPPLVTTDQAPGGSPRRRRSSASRIASIEGLVGEQFGGYVLEEAIGRGGMGVVFRARQLEPRRTVALKLMRAGALAAPDELKRFEHEAHAVAALDHPGIVPVFEYGQIEGIRYFSMPWVQGESLEVVLKQGVLEPREAARVALEVADAVAYAHDRGIIHRDLKPSNILVDRAGGRRSSASASSDSSVGSTVGLGGDSSASGSTPSAADASGRLARTTLRIADFGLAKSIDSGDDLTHTGQVMGTPGYMAPEQAWGEQSRIGKPTDVYAIGAILYRALTGKLPVEGTNFLETILKTRDLEPTTTRKYVAGVPRALDAICLKCLEREPSRRYADAGELAADLRAFQREEPIKASRPGVVQRIRRWNRTYPFLASHVWGLLFLFVIVQLNWLTMGSELTYHLRISGMLVAWLLLAIGLQVFVAGKALQQPVAAIWLALDAAIMTIFLLVTKHDPSQLLIGYPTLTLASALFEKVRSVAVMTGVTMLAHASLLVLRPELCDPWSHAVLFQALLLIIGFLAASLVRRIKQYRRIFEERR
jgi:serine/threonine-protein kinase